MRQKEHFIEDPFDFLKEDHKRINTLLNELRDEDRLAHEHGLLLSELTDALLLHSDLEKEVLYPVLKTKAETSELALEAIEAHGIIEVLLEELNDTPEDVGEWDARLAVLTENVERHVKEEEHELFKKAHKALSKEERDILARAMEDFLTGEDILIEEYVSV